MENENTPAQPATPAKPESEIRAQAQKDERKRVNQLVEIGRKLGKSDQADKAIEEGLSVEQFQGRLVAEAMQSGEQNPLGKPAADLGMSESEKREYSLFRAINAARTGDWSKAGYERECSQAIAEELGRDARGFFVPNDILGRGYIHGERAVDSGLTGANGGHLVPEMHMAGSFIELLRNRSAVLTRGARLLTGLVGNVQIPKQLGGASTYWVDEDGNTTASDPSFGNVALSPKTISARVDLTRRILLQSSPDVENLVRQDLATSIALGIDAAAISGTGNGGQPTGILNTNGIGAVVMGDPDGGAPDFAKIVELETQIAAANADMGTLAYMTNAYGRGTLKTTPRVSGYPSFLWESGELNGYAAAVSNQVPGNLSKGANTNLSAVMFGNWADVLIGEWGVLDIKADEVTKGDAGGLVLRAFQDVDVALRHAASFAAAQDMITGNTTAA